MGVLGSSSDLLSLYGETKLPLTLFMQSKNAKRASDRRDEQRVLCDAVNLCLAKMFKEASSLDFAITQSVIVSTKSRKLASVSKYSSGEEHIKES